MEQERDWLDAALMPLYLLIGLWLMWRERTTKEPTWRS